MLSPTRGFLTKEHINVKEKESRPGPPGKEICKF
jgi:hypothetical protein